MGHLAWSPLATPKHTASRSAGATPAVLAGLRKLLLGAATLLSACSTLQPSTPPSASQLQQGITVVRSLPKQLPDKSSPFPHAQFVLLAPENPAELISPVPFVADAVVNHLHSNAAKEFETRYSDIDPYRITLAALQRSAVLNIRQANGLQLQPFVFVQDCIDDRYRLTLVAHLQSADWVGRYSVHLPATYSDAEYAKPSPELLAKLRGELLAGAEKLRDLIEREFNGQLQPSGVRAHIGSLHLVGGRSLGLINPELLVARDVAIIEDSPEHLLVRMPGDMKAPASLGGLFFGVHYFQKVQLHTFKTLTASNP